MPVKHIKVPIKGLITDAPSTMIDKMSSTGMKAIRIHEGQVEKDYGYTKYPALGNYLDGNPVMKLEQFHLEDTTTQLIALTTKNAFKYNPTLESWQCISNAGASAGVCDAIWTTGWTKMSSFGVKTPTGETANEWVAVTDDGVTEEPAYGRVASTECLGGYYYYIDTDLVDTDYLYYTNDYGSFVNANGWVVRSRLKVVTSGDTAGQVIYVADDTKDVAVTFNSDKIFIDAAYISEATQEYAMDTTDAYHVYEIVVKATAVKVYVDGTLRVSGTLDHADTSDTIHFGDKSATTKYGGIVYWDYICYSVTDDTRILMAHDITTTRNPRVGTYSLDFMVDAGHTTGLIGYLDVTNYDYDSGYTGVHFWIRSSVATDAGDLTIRFSDANGCASEPDASAPITVPALTANVWTGCYVEHAGDYYSSTESIGLVIAVDKGAIRIDLDEITAVNAFTGDEGDRWSTATMNDTYIATNGVDKQQKYTGAGVFADLTTTLNSGTITLSKLVFTFKDHLCLAYNTENASSVPTRVTWSNIGTIEDFVGGTAGYQDLNDNEGFVMAAEHMGDDVYSIYKQRSITEMRWVGGATPFRFTPMVDKPGAGTLTIDGVINTGGEHVVFGQDYVYAYNGSTDIERIDYAVSQHLYGALNSEYIERVFTYFDKEWDEIQLWIPTSGAHVDTGFCMDVKTKNWYKKYKSITCVGEYQAQSALTFGDIAEAFSTQNWTFGSAKAKADTPIVLLGNYSGYTLQDDITTYNADGVVVESYFETPDFTIPDEEYEDKQFRVTQLMYEAKGSSVTTHYSTDFGGTWNATQGGGTHVATLDSAWTLYRQDFDSMQEQIRFRFYNNTVSTGFILRYYGFNWMPRSRR